MKNSGKLVVLGASEVGKSCLSLRLVRNMYNDN